MGDYQAAAGVFLNLIGVVILFIWGPLPSGVRGGVSVVVVSSAEEALRGLRHTRVTYIGLAAVVAGSVLQIAAAMP